VSEAEFLPYATRDVTLISPDLGPHDFDAGKGAATYGWAWVVDGPAKIERLTDVSLLALEESELSFASIYPQDVDNMLAKCLARMMMRVKMGNFQVGTH
jgi:hypothetical protein